MRIPFLVACLGTTIDTKKRTPRESQKHERKNILVTGTHFLETHNINIIFLFLISHVFTLQTTMQQRWFLLTFCYYSRVRGKQKSASASNQQFNKGYKQLEMYIHAFSLPLRVLCSSKMTPKVAYAFRVCVDTCGHEWKLWTISWHRLLHPLLFELLKKNPPTLERFNLPRQAPKGGTLSHLAYWNLLHKILDVAA